MELEELTKEIAERAAQVRERMDRAFARSGRSPDSVTLIAVVKTFGPEAVRAAHAAGLRHFGESYAQDLRDKTAAMADLDDVNWHFIGRLQTNKVRYLSGTVGMVHAIDRIEAAAALSDRLVRDGSPVLDVLLSVNLGGEDSKSGVAEEDLTGLWDKVADLPGLSPKGLMCLPPWSEDPEQSRPYFRRLRELAESMKGKMETSGVFHLSMGMSHDLEVAIEEGSTLVRVGTDLMGTRERSR